MARNKNSTFRMDVSNGFDFDEQMKEEKAIEEKQKSTSPTIEEPKTAFEGAMPESVNTVTRQEQPKAEEQGLVNVMPRENLGRPRIYTEKTKTISCKLKESNYEYARINGGRYGGMTGYINYLIEKDRGVR